MKKKVSFIVLAIVIVSLVLIFRINHGWKTIEEAFAATNPNPISIMHEEKIDKGSIVLYSYVGKNNSIGACFVKKNIFGYKYVYGIDGEMEFMANKFGLSHLYLSKLEKTAFPIYFGTINNPNIKQVKIVEKKRNIEGLAKIINTNDTRIWLLDMDKFQGSDFEIIGLSSEGNEIIKLKDSIIP